ncbi:hypothetical protein BDW59DRAFT_144395 [Aspergillus cavernicola]|uniref:Uncharacterized protein n=1 Tax=Aspergillus cavernicola TaxID=176166 RepID=A0ABR4IHF8_9EURO
MAYLTSSSSSFSTTTSTFSTFSAPAPAPAHRTSTSRSGSRSQSHLSLSKSPSTLKLKQWFASHLSSRLDSNNTYHDNHNNKLSIPITETETETSTEIAIKNSTTTTPRSSETTHIHTHVNNHPYLDFDQNNDTYNPSSEHSRDEYSRDFSREREREREDPLSDDYAAYCRAFTSSPIPFHHQQREPTPLPRLPQSTFYEDHPSLEQNPAGAEPGILFLPVGAHGYDPASWALPRPPTPPPGILTPARYEEIQRREKEDQDRDKQKEGRLTWCLRIRVSWLPWGRAKEP